MPRPQPVRPPLTSEQQALAASCYRLACREALRSHRAVPIDLDEALSVAHLGLVKAAQGFDPTRGFQFTTYATRCIRNELHVWRRGQARTYGRFRTQCEIVGHHGRPVDLLDLVPSRGPPVDAELAAREERDAAEALLAIVRERVTEKEWQVLVARTQGSTLRDLGVLLGVSKERIRQICLRAIVKARGGEEVDDLEGRLHHECPRRILGVLHVKGVYRHYRSPADGRVLCVHWQTPVPEGLERTAAQGLLEATSPPLDGTERIADNRQRGKGL